MQTLGIDISAWQRGLSLSQAQAQGINYAIIKFAGADSGKYKDSQCEKFYADAKAIGMPVGAYYFAKCSNEAGAIEEAKHFLSVINGKTFPCKVWYDIEASMQNLPSTTLNAIAKAFCQYMKANGYDCGVYANSSTFKRIDFDGSFSAAYPKWVANWSKTKPSNVIDGRDMWQFSGGNPTIMNNKIGGITCDLDYCYFDIGSVTPVVPVPTPADEVARPTLSFGNSGEEVRKLQNNLNKFGYRLKADGIWGKDTETAFRGFQLLTELTPDGIYGKDSAAMMGKYIK